MDYTKVLKHVINGDYVRVDEYIVESVNKQIAIRAKKKLYNYVCPICETVISNGMNYCPNCGQHIEL